MCNYTHMNSRDIIKMLENDGWKLVRVNGSHHHFAHDKKSGIVTVPHPKRDLPAGTFNSILKQAGLKKTKIKNIKIKKVHHDRIP